MNILGIASNLYGWQERYREEGKDMSYANIFRDLALAGYDAVEATADPETVALARACNLTISASYIGLPLHEAFAPGALEDKVLPTAILLAEAGGSDLLVNADPKGGWHASLPKDEEDSKRQGENLTRIATRLAPYGLNVCMHNHAADPHNANADLRSVVRHAGTEVGLCVDTGWALVSGCDPLDWVRRYPERIHALHLRNQHGPVPSEDLLEGDMDMAQFLRSLADLGYRGWLAMELWHPPATAPQRSMLEDARRSVNFVRQCMAELI